VQEQAIIGARGSWLIGETGAIQQAKKKITGAIAGKHPAGAIAAVRRGRQAKNEKFGVRIAESGDRAPPIRPIAISAPLGVSHALAILNQTRAAPARDDLLV
jgi:hypothetical protein